jgi:hypothetical protein
MTVHGYEAVGRAGKKKNVSFVGPRVGTARG